MLDALTYLLLTVLCVGSLLPISRGSHWFVRGWDFPRVQIIALAWGIVIAHIAVAGLFSEIAAIETGALVGIAAAITGWHLFRIVPYTPLVRTQAKPYPCRPLVGDSEKRQLRILMTNVQQGNEQKSLWSDVVRAAEADVVIAAEIDSAWSETLQRLNEPYPHQILEPQDNCYGLAMLSRLPIVDHRTRFLVQDDVPSIDSTIVLPSGDHVRVVGVHPRPPEPLRDTNSAARDGELALWGEELAEHQGPVVIGGDLNDVAWSKTTRLFLRISGLLDPRRGRGFFNTFHANHWWMRFPLDHVFHSTHFLIRDLHRLQHVGSDHFPILIDLQLQPKSRSDHEPLEGKSQDQEQVEQRIETAEKADDTKPPSQIPSDSSEVTS